MQIQFSFSPLFFPFRSTKTVSRSPDATSVFFCLETFLPPSPPSSFSGSPFFWAKSCWENLIEMARRRKIATGIRVSLCFNFGRYIELIFVHLNIRTKLYIWYVACLLRCLYVHQLHRTKVGRNCFCGLTGAFCQVKSYLYADPSDSSRD